MSALLGEGDRADEYLGTLLDDFIQPNTMYKEGSSPVMETPLSGAQSLHDMLVQSHGATIRVFPAVPEAWDDAVIHELRTEGRSSSAPRAAAAGPSSCTSRAWPASRAAWRPACRGRTRCGTPAPGAP